MTFKLLKQRQTIMRCSWMVVVSLIGLNLSLAEPVKGQSWEWIYADISMNDASIIDVFDSLTSKTGYAFLYSPEVKAHKGKYSLNYDNTSVKEILQDLADQAGMKLTLVDWTVVANLMPRKEGELKHVQLSTKARILTGVVMDVSGDPLSNATVRVKGYPNLGTFTNAEGRFEINVPDEAEVLLVSFVGYQTQELTIGEKLTFNIVLEESLTQIGEVVVIGYGTTSRQNLTTAISKIGNDQIKDQPVTSFDEALAGRLPGVDISMANGAPGGGVNINIRGISAITSGTAPLIVVDGVPLSNSLDGGFAQGRARDGNFDSEYALNPLSTINPNDIESIEVLKDAASAAIYGSRGSNGVILITTKKGSYQNAPKVNFNAYWGTQSLAKKVDVMNAQEFANYSELARGLSWVNKDPENNSISDPNDVRANGDRVVPYILPYLNGANEDLPNTDWQDEVYQNAPIQNYELSVRGGSNRFRYFVSGNYFDQEGIFVNSGIKRYSVRANIEANINKNLRFGVNLNPTYSDHKIVNSERNWWKEGLTILTLMAHPNISPRNPDGSLRLGEMLQANEDGFVVALIENPLAVALLTTNTLTHSRLLGSAFAEVDILDGLTFRANVGTDLNFYDRFYYRPKVLSWRGEPAPTSNANYAWSNNSNSLNWLSENTLTYEKDFNQHYLNVLLGYTVQKEIQEQQYLEGRNFPNDNVTSLNAALATNGFSNERESSIISYLGRISYSFADKYLLSATIRRDGSSRFAENSKWGVFPSVSAGWRISDEPFFTGLSAISELKLRASFGQTGNFNIPFYGGTALLSEANYVINDQVTTGLAPVTAPNDELSWETTETFDIGLDVGLFENRLILTADYYHSNTTDLLLNVSVPSSTGFTNSLQNIGELENKGFELGLATSLQFGDLTWDGAVNVYTNQNEVLALAPGQDQLLAQAGLNNPSFIVRVGEPIGSFFGYNVLGIFESQEEFNNTPNLGGNQGVGDFIYEDTDGDGDVDPDDRVVLGNANPEFNWGFNSTFEYKGIDLSFNLQGKHGVERFNAMHRYLAETWGNNLSVYLEDDAPRPVWGVGTSSHTRSSSWHVEDASFVRMRNLTLGYTFPFDFTQKIAIDNLRIYATSLNLFTITDYSGYNPEVSSNGSNAVTAGEEFGNYPIARSFIFGINLGF